MKFIRVNRKSPCPVCGYTDWCSLSSDRSFAFCMRVQEGSIKTAKNGAYIHALSNPSTKAFEPIQAKAKREKPQSKRAHSEQLQNVYSAMLELLALEEKHKKDLQRRGLSHHVIEANDYKSTPSIFDSSQVAFELSQRFDLCGVPGFYFDYGTWRMVKMREGFFVPVRNSQGHIHGLQYRLENPIDGKQKYLWLSSGYFYKGASSSSPVHFAKPGLIHQLDEVLLTEGALKADVISYLTKKPVIAFAGVSSFGANFSFNLRKRFPNLRKTILCFDADRYEKRQVCNAMFKLGNELRRAYFDVCVCDWSSDQKGYDDFLIEQIQKGG